MRREERFVAGETFHIFNKSIAGFKIFNTAQNSQRFLQASTYYNRQFISESLSNYLKKKRAYKNNLLDFEENGFIKCLAYCIMPDHYHLLVKVLINRALSYYIGRVENSYSHYFNLKFKRKGPLWQSVFKAVRVKTNEQLLHVSRYIHLNPTSSGLVLKPEDWEFSSYRSYIHEEKYLKNILTEVSISNPKTYQKFCEDQIGYQKKLNRIKKLLLD